MMSETKLWVIVIVGTIVVITVLALGSMGLSWHAAHVDCLRLHEQTGYPTRMVGTMFGGGCYIFIDGRWIPDSRYRMVDTDAA